MSKKLEIKVKVFYKTEPVIETKTIEGQEGLFGLHRDRNPDAGWGEWRWSKIDDKVKEVDVIKNPELLEILYQDIADYYGSKPKKFIEKLKEFKLLVSQK